MIQVHKPLDPQAFERHCVVLWRLLLNNQATDLYGRNGQEQHGVDILGYREGRSDQPVGIQCKLRTQGCRLTHNEVTKEVAKALSHHKDLVEYYIVTTAPNDARLQDLAATLTKEWEGKSKIRQISVWGWEALQERIVLYPEALKAFEPNYSPYIETIVIGQAEIIENIEANNTRLTAIFDKMIEVTSLRTGIPVTAIHEIVSQNGYEALTPEQAIVSLKTISEDLKALMSRPSHKLEGGAVVLIEERRAQALLRIGDLDGYVSELENALAHRRVDQVDAVKSQYELLTKVSKARAIQQRFDDAIAFLEEAANLFEHRKDLPSEPFIARWQISLLTYLKARKTTDRNLFDACRRQLDNLQSSLYVQNLEFLKVRLLINRYSLELSLMVRTFDYDNIFNEIKKLNEAWCLMSGCFAEDVHQHEERSCDIRYMIGRATDDQDIVRAALLIAKRMCDVSKEPSGPERGQASRWIVSQSLFAKISAFLANRGWANASTTTQLVSRVVDDLLDFVSRTPVSELTSSDLMHLSSAIEQVARLRRDNIYPHRMNEVYLRAMDKRHDPEFVNDMLTLDAAHARWHLRFWDIFRQPAPYQRIDELTRIAKSGLEFEDHWEIGLILELQADCYAQESLLHGGDNWGRVVNTYISAAASFQKVFEVSPIFAQRALWRARNKALTLEPRAYF